MNVKVRTCITGTNVVRNCLKTELGQGTQREFKHVLVSICFNDSANSKFIGSKRCIRRGSKTAGMIVCPHRDSISCTCDDTKVILYHCTSKTIGSVMPESHILVI